MYTDADKCLCSFVLKAGGSSDKINADYPNTLSESKLSCCSELLTLQHHYSSPGLCWDEAVYLMTGSQDIESSTRTAGL